jgi:hypothetical protein
MSYDDFFRQAFGREAEQGFASFEYHYGNVFW